MNCIMSSLFDLNDDVLRAVLVRTWGPDLPNLCLTCSRFNAIINSPQFVNNDVKVVLPKLQSRFHRPLSYTQSNNKDIFEGALVSPNDDWFQENYNDFGRRNTIFGYQESEARIYMDGKLAGTSAFTLLPRNNRQFNFHEMCYSVSEDCQETGCAFFDRFGRTRLQAIKQVLSTDNHAPVLYIKSFDLWKSEYRTTTTTCAKALRKLLTDDTKFKDTWSVAAYIPDPRTQFHREDRELEANYGLMAAMREVEDSEVGEASDDERNWQERRDMLTKQDMRQFLK